jgi:hypothetical protein
MSSISSQELNDQIKRLNGNPQKLDLLLAVEEIMDEMDLFAFANWEEGEVLSGPDVDRHWVTVRLIYPHHQMPDPHGAKRLLRRNCLVKFQKGKLTSPVKVKTPDDLTVETTDTGEAKLRARAKIDKIWIITIQIPREMVDDFDTSQVKLNDEEFLDMEAVSSSKERD